MAGADATARKNGKCRQTYTSSTKISVDGSAYLLQGQSAKNRQIGIEPRAQAKLSGAFLPRRSISGQQRLRCFLLTVVVAARGELCFRGG